MFVFNVFGELLSIISLDVKNKLSLSLSLSLKGLREGFKKKNGLFSDIDQKGG